MIPHTRFATGVPENQAFIEVLDDRKDGDGDTAASDISDRSTQVCSQSYTHRQKN